MKVAIFPPNAETRLGLYGHYVDTVTLPDNAGYNLIGSGDGVSYYRPVDQKISDYYTWSFRADHAIRENVDLSLVGRNVSFGNDGFRNSRATAEEAAYWIELRGSF